MRRWPFQSSEQAPLEHFPVIEDLLRCRSLEVFKTSLATLTGGSGAVAVLVTDGSFGDPRRRLRWLLPWLRARLLRGGLRAIQRRGAQEQGREDRQGDHHDAGRAAQDVGEQRVSGLVVGDDPLLLGRDHAPPLEACHDAVEGQVAI